MVRGWGHVLPNGKQRNLDAIAEQGLREAGAPGRPYLTDGGNFILDCQCGEIPDPDSLCEALNTIPGVVENGIFPLFPKTVRTVVLGGADGVRVLEL